MLTLASTQVGMEEKFFAINKKMSEGVWLYDQIQDKEKFVFDKTDYELYWNPIVLAERIDEIDNSVSLYIIKISLDSQWSNTWRI